MKKILVVDGRKHMNILLRDILENNGFRVVGQAGDGIRALKLYQDLKPDIVTIGITQPGPDCIEILGMLKAYDGNARVVMISAIRQEWLIRKALTNGADAFIIKTFRIE